MSALEPLLDGLVSLEPFSGFYLSVLRLAAVFLMALALSVLIIPEQAKHFLSGYASTLLVNSVEGVLRALVGLSLAGYAHQQGLSAILVLVGVFLVVSALVILLLPGLHKRFARWAIPFALRILPLYGAGAAVLGIGLFMITQR
ncbi:MAG: hypothetical protein CMH91_04400 [Oceanicaulis sp.]|uniref:hypothetical protein n=1 Tax=unclassified Oceanicaulis TaxID=2632123 RepID=UPI000C38309A|nr:MULTISPECIES: hypothetical protein [unclassified Oceanicaulis]MAB70211.1 hypothetical protein [Oceanicaulis sp.]MBC38292.1 hypothetical protein [Oceanicaulis sp.]MBG36447.1 hypothetical protein [Oceanicaulis sp.]HCR94925.1 hypothetical protein [Oceanicaulis sp.]|tara:strand:- start:503 stop:934 length:432 start_codon:yes stop_codon:yes gene_type:complete